MATPPNDDTKLLFRLLADGEWHSYEEVRSAIAARVPPGRALRKYEERIEYKRKYKNQSGYDTNLSEDERIFFGARACAQIVITSWKGRGIDFTGTAENKQIRRKPGFKTWGVDSLPDDPVEPEIARGDTEVPESDSVASEPEGEAAQEPTRWECALPPDNPHPAHGMCPGVQERKPGPEVYPEATDEDVAEVLRRIELDKSESPEPEPPSLPVTAAPLMHCAECGLWMLDQDKHRAWHIAVTEQKDRDDMALFSESDVRNLIEEIVAKQLDKFQVGMQGYLAAQFAQLEGTLAVLAGLPWRSPKQPPMATH